MAIDTSNLLLFPKYYSGKNINNKNLIKKMIYYEQKIINLKTYNIGKLFYLLLIFVLLYTSVFY